MAATLIAVLCLFSAALSFLCACVGLREDFSAIREDSSKREPVDVCRVGGGEHVWGEVQQSTISGIVHQYQTCVTCNLRQERVDGMWM